MPPRPRIIAYRATRHRTLALVSVVGSLLAAAALPQRATADDAPVTVHATVDRTEATIGDPIRYTVVVSAAVDMEVVIPVLSGQLGAFTITDFGDQPAQRENGRAMITRWYTLTAFTTGDQVVPPPTVQYRRSGEELQTVSGNSVTVSVLSLLAKAPGAADIRDIKPPEEVPFDWRPYAIAVGAVIAVALLGAGFFYVLNRPKRQRIVPPRPPHEVALAALTRLRGRRLIEDGKYEEFYVELSAIIRRYLEDRFHIRAPEMTTEEFLATAGGDGRLDATQRRLLGDFLTQADLVKFARHHPTLHDSQAAGDAARRFIDETQPVPATSEVQHAAA